MHCSLADAPQLDAAQKHEHTAITAAALIETTVNCQKVQDHLGKGNVLQLCTETCLEGMSQQI